MTAPLVSQQGDTYCFDIVVVGSGIAACAYILEVTRLYPRARIALLSKAQLQMSSSAYAQGGVAAALPPDDDLTLHIEDTLSAGGGLSEPAIVEALLQEGTAAIDFLLAQGMPFDRESGQLARGQEAGHSRRRIYHAGDHTGAVLIDTLLTAVRQLSQVAIFENHTAINLITHLTPQPTVLGVYVLNNHSQQVHIFSSAVCVLATGGAGKVFRYTSNPEVATGDGVAMAYRAGAQVKNMEFYQFHPTMLYHLQENNFLLTEALRGEGAYLRHPATGERFMKYYAPEQMELATRDVVARAIFKRLKKASIVICISIFVIVIRLLWCVVSLPLASVWLTWV